MKKETNKSKKPSPLTNIGFWIAIGVGIGAAIGTAMDNIGSGIAVGIGIGIALWAGFKAQADKKDKGDQ